VGIHAFIGGYSVLTRDVLPFVKTVGIRNDAKIYGINTIGLERRGFSEGRLKALNSAYRMLFRKGLKLKDAVRQIRNTGELTPDVEILVGFIETCERGFVR
jgi:UDP-N-acetylglucosamine acyltransferase